MAAEAACSVSPSSTGPRLSTTSRALFDYILEISCDVVTAIRFTDRLLERCEKIGNAPSGGVARPDLGPGIRIVPFERKVVILYVIREQTVWITNVFSGRRDYAALTKTCGERLTAPPAIPAHSL